VLTVTPKTGDAKDQCVPRCVPTFPQPCVPNASRSFRSTMRCVPMRPDASPNASRACVPCVPGVPPVTRTRAHLTRTQAQEEVPPPGAGGFDVTERHHADSAPRQNFPPRLSSTSARGYGTAWQALRAGWSRIVAGGRVRCARGSDCRFAVRVDGRMVGGLIDPGEPWDLGHDDFDRSRVSGPEHRACNRATAPRRVRGSRRW
jgi:hypothetical protein